MAGLKGVKRRPNGTPHSPSLLLSTQLMPAEQEREEEEGYMIYYDRLKAKRSRNDDSQTKTEAANFTAQNGKDGI